MKRIVLCIGLAVFLMLMGCGKQEEPAQTKEKVITDVQQKVEAGKEYLAQQKQEYQDKMAKKMAEFQNELSLLP